MPSNVVKSFAERSGKTIDEVEAVWKESKAQADHSEQFHEKDSHYWSYVVSVTESKLGLKKKDSK